MKRHCSAWDTRIRGSRAGTRSRLDSRVSPTSRRTEVKPRADGRRSSRLSRRPKRPAGLPSTGRPVRRAALAEVKDDLSRFLRLAESEDILITRHGKPAGVLIGFESEDDWFDYRLEHHPEFLRRVAAAREALRSGRGVRLEDLPS